MEIRPVAYFVSPLKTKFGIPRQSGICSELRGKIVFAPEYRNPDAVRGLEEFDYLWLVWEFSANARNTREWSPTVRPPRLGGNERLGVFATRSPFRPNPLGLSSAKIESIELDSEDGPVINVLGADLMDGTPIYDIKPYITYSDSHPEARSGFVDQNSWKTLEVVIPEELLSRVKSKSALVQVLSQDPRPQYHDDPDRIYGMEYDGMDVRFKVSGEVLTVVEIV
ncbi:MAG: tRNA (N6-threonylcarbamoyladenosine(37)-N6)-methyltransferase TrmO [Bacteroidales bacterium]|nr:tRNA (N6-threonylcarbamoyladenosine(37)-N6)-methyltransferase TrmO [Bacteroidales bacterium]